MAHEISSEARFVKNEEDTKTETDDICSRKGRNDGQSGIWLVGNSFQILQKKKSFLSLVQLESSMALSDADEHPVECAARWESPSPNGPPSFPF